MTSVKLNRTKADSSAQGPAREYKLHFYFDDQGRSDTRVKVKSAVFTVFVNLPGADTQVAINWTICKGALPIPGAKNARQAREAAGAPQPWQPPSCNTHHICKEYLNGLNTCAYVHANVDSCCFVNVAPPHLPAVVASTRRASIPLR